MSHPKDRLKADPLNGFTAGSEGAGFPGRARRDLVSCELMLQQRTLPVHMRRTARAWKISRWSLAKRHTMPYALLVSGKKDGSSLLAKPATAPTVTSSALFVLCVEVALGHGVLHPGDRGRRRGLGGRATDEGFCNATCRPCGRRTTFARLGRRLERAWPRGERRTVFGRRNNLTRPSASRKSKRPRGSAVVAYLGRRRPPASHC